MDGESSSQSDSDSSSNSSVDELMQLVEEEEEEDRQVVDNILMFGMYYETYLHKSPKRTPTETGLAWVEKNLADSRQCFNMFRMSRPIFDQLHNLLVESYGLQSTAKNSSVEALAMFLWMVGSPQSVRQAENRMVRSLETVHRNFDKVLASVLRLAADIIKLVDPEFRTPHHRLNNPRFYPYFNNCIGAIDGTHIPVVVPADKVVQYMCRKGYTTQNVMAVCDFVMRFTFALAGWPGSVHDMRVFNDAIQKYSHKFPHPPAGKFYLVDSGYANRPGYLAPYKGLKYHLPEFCNGPMPRGKKEIFNFVHSSLRNVIERAFGVLKMKWRILLKMPKYSIEKQSQIIIACMALHNFIRDSNIGDKHFDRCDCDENYVPLQASTSQPPVSRAEVGEEDQNMNAFHEEIANALFSRS